MIGGCNKRPIESMVLHKKQVSCWLGAKIAVLLSFFSSLHIWVVLGYRAIGLINRVFTNGPGDWGSTPGRNIPKTQQWYLEPPCLTPSVIRQRSRVKWSNPGNGIALSPTPPCSSYLKESLLVTNITFSRLQSRKMDEREQVEYFASKPKEFYKLGICKSIDRWNEEIMKFIIKV